MKIHTKDANEIAKLAGEKLCSFLLSSKKRPILLLLSGGSSLGLLEYVDPTLCGKNVTISVVDERFDLNESNFKKLSETLFFKKSILNGASYIDPFVTKDDTFQSVAYCFNKSITSWINNNIEGFIFATLGMGEDGHIAGIMPFPENNLLFKELFDDPTVFVRGYDAGTKNKFSLRITSTLSLLKKITHAVVFIAGESKKIALESVFKKTVALSDIPAVVLHDLSSVDLYTDISNLPVIE